MVAVFLVAVGVAPATVHAQSTTGVYWLDSGPERGPYNDQTLRHGHYSASDVFSNSVFLSLPNYNVPMGLAVDAGEGKVYTNHRSLFTGIITIRKMNLDGSGLETLHTFPGGAYGQMEFNPADGKLYIFNGASFARMNATSAAIAAGGGVNVEQIPFPAGYSVTRGDIDLVNGTLVVMNTAAPGNWPFVAIDFDGSNPTPLGAVCPPHTCYQGFTVDARSEKIYYSRRGQGADPLGYVYVQNYDGTDNVQLFGPSGSNQYLNAVSLAIDFEDDRLYMGVGREGFGAYMSRGKLDGSQFELQYNTGGLDAAPVFVALGSVPSGGGGGGPVDTDGDGVPDDEDAFPNDPTESADTDGDGVGDNGDAFPNDPTESVDTDGDGVGDNGDAFPNDPTESADTDGDGVGDNGDAFPNDPTESADTDGDSVGDNGDLCAVTVYDTMELNPNQWALREGSTNFIQGVNRKGKSSGGSYSITETGGCSCSDIVEAAGLGQGHLKKGCSNSVMADWAAHVASTLGKGGTPSAPLSQRLDANQEPANGALPTEFVLTGNYPNPFNPQTSIQFGLPEAAHVTLAVYDLMGRRVRVLIDGTMSAGMHQASFDAGSLPSGAYLYQLTTPAGSITKTMMLLK
ncbi:MAG: T9SS type A sorting domain-containing protein [Rhodothermales bacterium]